MIIDPIERGLAAGWNVLDASEFEADQDFEADVVIIGSGAGGGVSAEILTKAGLKVLLVEEGPLKSSRDFKMREADAYPHLYQESAARKTKDKAINILQGRCVGGSTTVNWTTSFRTPPDTLDFWQRTFGLKDYSEENLAPWFVMMERRLNIEPWQIPANENNDLLRRGAEELGIESNVIRRNVKGCANLGYCGMGCPLNAKQSMLVTTIPAALDGGATLLTRLRAERLHFSGDKVSALQCVAMQLNGVHPKKVRITLRARHFVLAGGAIGSPALLLRSEAPDPFQLTGARTFLHPTVLAASLMPQQVAGHSGAPQSIYSDHYLKQSAIDGALGFKLEVPPLHPLMIGSILQGFGQTHASLMQKFNQVHATIALLRDGFHTESRGGQVGLNANGAPVLDYPLNDVLWDGIRRAWLAMAEIQYAAGAQKVWVVHEQCNGYTSWNEARSAITALPLEPLLARLVSAHVMGGCGMSDDATQGVVDSGGRHHQLANLSVCDGSVFPTSIGANPQLSIYGITARNISLLAEELTGKPAPAIA